MMAQHAPDTITESSALQFAARLLKVGVIVCMVAIIPLRGIGLCNAPKELVLDIAGLGAAALCLFSTSRIELDSVDLCFAGFLLLSIASACFAAVDQWEAMRAFAMSAAGFAVYWCARYLSGRGFRQRLIEAVALATVIVAIGVLFDAIGVTDHLSYARPGGTLGNRNWAAHLLALGMPLLAFGAVSRWKRRFALSLIPLLLTTAAMVVARSRAGWIAMAFGTIGPLIFLAISARRSSQSSSAALRTLAVIAVGIVAGAILPTELQWHARHPYTETLRTIVKFDSGSGHGRIEQYRNSLTIVSNHKLLGVGPANWKIVYPAYAPDAAAPGDPAWNVPTRSNSDLFGIAAERGVPAILLLLAALIILAIRSLRSIFDDARSTTPDACVESMTMLGILIALAIVGALDAVLQLPAPAFVFFLSIGALTPRCEALWSIQPGSRARLASAIATASFGALVSVYLVNGMYVSELLSRGTPASLRHASRLALDEQWLHAQALWDERARQLAPGVYPGCD